MILNREPGVYTYVQMSGYVLLIGKNTQQEDYPSRQLARLLCVSLPILRPISGVLFCACFFSLWELCLLSGCFLILW